MISFSAPLVLFVAGATLASTDVSPCPEGWTFFFKAKKCYKYFPVIKDFNGARALCQENGGDIAIATELGENNFVSFTFTDQKLWLGGQRIGATKDFQWTYRGGVVSDTTKFIPQQFLPWLPNQPSNSGGDENCVITNWPSDSNRLSEWNDISCSRNDLAQVVCEKPQDIVPSNNNLIGNIATWGKSFRISFDLKFDSWPTATTWSSLLHFTTDPSRDCCSIGQRIPAFLFSTYGGGRRLNVYTQLGSKGNAGLSAVVYWNLGTWYNVEVEQSLEGTKTYFYIRVNGVTVKKDENTAPREYSNVKVYSGLTDTARWSGPPSDAVIRNLQYYNL